MSKKTYLYLCQDETEDLFIEDKAGVESCIRADEESDSGTGFEILGQICKDGLTADFPASKIEWFSEQPNDKVLVDKAVLLIVQSLHNSRAFIV